MGWRRCGFCHIKATLRSQNLQRTNSLNSRSFGNSPISGWHPVSSVYSRRTMLPFDYRSGRAMANRNDLMEQRVVELELLVTTYGSPRPCGLAMTL